MRRLLMVGRTRYTLPLDASLARKFDALGDQLDVRVLAARPAGAHGSDPRFRLFGPAAPGTAGGSCFLARCCRSGSPRELRSWRPDAVLSQGGQETALVLLGRAISGISTRVIMDVHGDPGAATRLYGSSSRRALAPLGDLLTRIAIRRADAVRTISAYTTGLVRSYGVEPSATFPAFMDLDPFVSRAAGRSAGPTRGAVRRCPRALQGRRRPRGRLASGRSSGARSRAAARRAGNDDRNRRTAGRRAAALHRRGCRGFPRPRSRARSTRRPCWCSRRVPKGSAAS